MLRTSMKMMGMVLLMSPCSVAFAIDEPIVVQDLCYAVTNNDDAPITCWFDGKKVGVATPFYTGRDQIDQNDPNSWPTNVTNYLTTKPDDLGPRCLQMVREFNRDFSLPASAANVLCQVEVDWVAPWAIAYGTDSFDFGDPIENGRLGDVTGVLATLKSVGCWCMGPGHGPD